MLNHVKMICYMNHIAFNTHKFLKIRDDNEIGDTITISIHDDSMIESSFHML
jgi:hypothetical protein